MPDGASATASLLCIAEILGDAHAAITELRVPLTPKHVSGRRPIGVYPELGPRFGPYRARSLAGAAARGAELCSPTLRLAVASRLACGGWL